MAGSIPFRPLQQYAKLESHVMAFVSKALVATFCLLVLKGKRKEARSMRVFKVALGIGFNEDLCSTGEINKSSFAMCKNHIYANLPRS